MTADEVKRSLVEHDGLNPAIEVQSGAGRNVPGSVRFSAKNALLKKAVPLNTQQYGQGASAGICYKCKQPIQQGQTVTWEGGMEAHAGGCPPPQSTSPAQEQSRIMFPKGKQPQKPQMGQPAPQTPQRAPIKPQYASVERVATRRRISGYVPATSWGVPQENAHQVARVLAEHGMQDFDVATDEELHVAYFSFGNEVEMEVCADLVCQYFAPQIAASKGRWIGWQCRPERAPSVPPINVPLSKMNSKKEAGAIDKLKALGIKTTADLDAWIKKNPRKITKGPYAGQMELPSRFEALTEIVGADNATWILHEMATNAAAKEIPSKRSAEELDFEELLKKQGAAATMTLPQFESWWDQLKAVPNAIKNFSIKKVPGIGVTNGALEFSYKGKPLGYLGFPVSALESVTGPIEQFLQSGQDEADDLTWDAIYDQSPAGRAGVPRNPLQQQNMASLKIAKPEPTDYKGKTIEQQVASLMEQRAFSKDTSGKGWAVYERHDGDIQIKVYFKDGKVDRAVMDGRARKGFEGLHSLTQTFGD